MKVHHLNCGTMRAPGGKLLDGQPGLLRRAEMVAHCLLIETGDGLVLVDTGFGRQGVARPGDWLGTPFTLMVGAKPVEEETAAHHVEALGHKPEDVRHIICTHLDVDHAGGLADFPNAVVHVRTAEHDAATAPGNASEKLRFRANQFAHRPLWSKYDEAGDEWFGFQAVRELKGLPPEILLVPLAGHTRGHTGVAVDTGDGWLLHAGDAYFFHGQLDPVKPHCPPGMTAFQNMVQTLRKPRLENVERLRELSREHADEVTVFSAHSPVEYQSLSRG
ncbi:MBL fold metallo-hydrolase [Amycolatopsis regifaucium]|uniref:MBL fold metallo-hydrolase n=1 Tax=Amycolatopsis regifaucium TaxID=546365 RepID=A0A154MSS8_9PSEU|nr:MBL fold metallo-hydrolase [Amycolatopsis regifaucium]KZB87321.1 MBL fold metallo-hydrolase [Amycolatopsis regifaucium]OKA08155.1 MBL fold metallo-hydrolase [Amycolatopsis regifaucium]SFI41451.1 Glyoxylase, beta-lactamase superfamily II [Amycolatopsis regifaucium]